MKGTIFTSEMLAEQAQRYVVENGYSDAEAVIEEMLERELTDGAACESLDGCECEPDGYCRHGWPSWLVYAGVI